MSLKDDLVLIAQPKSGRSCGTCAWLATLTAKDRDDFYAYISDPDANIAHLWRVIRERWGYKHGDSALKYCIRNDHHVRAR